MMAGMSRRPLAAVVRVLHSCRDVGRAFGETGRDVAVNRE
jgi:hypothetical protein